LKILVHLVDELILHDEVHRDGRADRGDSDSGSDEERYAKSKAHGSFIT
jgi:hypothetical protein